MLWDTVAPTAEMVFGLSLVCSGWLGYEHRSSCRRSCEWVHQHVPTQVSLSAPAPLPGGVPSPKLQERRSPVCTDQDSPVPPSLVAAALSKQGRSQPAAFGDPIRQSSSARFGPEEQFLLSAPWVAPGVLSSCGYCRQEQVHQPWQHFPCFLPSSWQRFWTAQLGHGLEQPATHFHGCQWLWYPAQPQTTGIWHSAQACPW